MFLDRIEPKSYDLIFYIGIFFLPTFPIFASILFLFLLVKGSLENKYSYFSDKLNIPFFYSGIFSILSCIYITFIQTDKLTGYSHYLTWIGLFNLLPFFLCFWVFQSFTFQTNTKKIIGICLILGCIPIIIAGILQYFFEIYGPFQFLNGIITWHLKDADGYQGMSSIFSNSNYTGVWLNLVTPFSLTYLLEKHKSIWETIFSYMINLLIILCTFLTFSRAAWLGLVLSLFLILGKRFYKWIFFVLLFISAIILISLGNFPNENIINYSRSFVPEAIWNYKFKEINILDFDNILRLKIWFFALKSIISKPLWGWGAGAFPILFQNQENIFFGHTHNLLLELAFNYGIPTALFFMIPLFFLILKSMRLILISKLKLLENNYDRAWITSNFLIFISQLYDVQYFDIRLSLMFWILFAGTRNIIN